MMAMIDALSAAAGLLGLGAFRSGVPVEPAALADWPEGEVSEEMAPPVPEPLAAGDPCYEAVAEALEKAGYLHS